MKCIKTIFNSLTILLITITLSAQDNHLDEKVRKAMSAATRYMVETVSNNGGYLWTYLPDFSRQWGEMEAYKTMIWLQDPGTISMGHVFIDAYHATGDEYYYQAAEKAAAAVIWGQHYRGGWNYVVDFAGDRSLKQWYNTIGKNGWRLEEFQHYYGNCTFDDDVTSDAARFLLRMYLEKLDPVYKPALDKAIEFILESQYPLGGWPQRYPLKYDFSHHGLPDYSSYYTFNDDVIWENIHFLIQCYLSLGQERFLDPIIRGMNFYVISQHGSGGWGQQYNLEMKPAAARTYEPEALLPQTTFGNAMLLLKFYEITGETKYLVNVPRAIEWLELVRLPKTDSENGKYSHPTFVEPLTNKALYVHRKGSNVKYGYYYHDYKDDRLLAHYGGKCNLPLEQLKKRYDDIKSPLSPGMFVDSDTPQKFYDLNRNSFEEIPEISRVQEIINAMDSQDRWLVKHVKTSNPYIGDGQKQELTDEFASTNVGDETDTSPYPDLSGQEYISTGAYILNMNLLINFLETQRN